MGSPSTARQGASAALTRNASPQFTREGIAAVIASLAADGFEVPANLAEFRYQMAVRPGAPERWKEVVAARNASVFATRLTEQDLQKIEHPTLILHGKSDKVISFTESVIGAQHIPNADLAVFAGCGHWVQLEREEDFISAVGGFIRRIASRDGNPP
jgi:pimeloyl-ACP methyl ester carboxylesterase